MSTALAFALSLLQKGCVATRSAEAMRFRVLGFQGLGFARQLQNLQLFHCLPGSAWFEGLGLKLGIT